ncbi:L,D-transpeptidase family protein [Microbacterium keratanolyticum]|uniref:L,D-transpeptidase family protein n=1 Tax=Microbacterium keratanolyticum TaxID=67574 RepID=UPI003642102B
MPDAPSESSGAAASTTAASPAEGVPSADERPVQWAEREPVTKKRHIGLWIGLGIGAAALAAGAASLILIAPGTSIAGVPVGGLTPGAAADALSNRVSTVEVTLNGAPQSPVVTASELGASIDAKALADQAFAERPAWNLGAWFGAPIEGKISVDPEKAEPLLRDLASAAYDDPIDAGVEFDATTSTFITTPAESGTGIDLDDLTAAIASAVAGDSSAVSFDAVASRVDAPVSDDDATAMAKSINEMLAGLGFYVGLERTVPVDAATAATWITVVDNDGELEIEADRKAIKAVVDALPTAVNRAPVNAQVVVNSSGEVLRDVTAGVAGRTLGDISKLTEKTAAQLEKGNGVIELPVTETPFTSTNLARVIDVNLSEQLVSVIENGTVIDSWYVSSGRGEFATRTGSFEVGWKTPSQNMGDQDLTKSPFYYQPDVKWVMYFNGDEAFHGVYWHSNWGTPMSHGCVGMPEWRAQWLYDWAPEGVDVNVHY